MYIKETFVNETDGYIFGNSAWYEAHHDNLGDLYRFLKSEYGNAKNMYIDGPDGDAIKIGWVFTGAARYEDTNEPYTRCVWVEVSATEPREEIVNINSPWK